MRKRNTDFIHYVKMREKIQSMSFSSLGSLIIHSDPVKSFDVWLNWLLLIWHKYIVYVSEQEVLIVFVILSDLSAVRQKVFHLSTCSHTAWLYQSWFPTLSVSVAFFYTLKAELRKQVGMKEHFMPTEWAFTHTNDWSVSEECDCSTAKQVF